MESPELKKTRSRQTILERQKTLRLEKKRKWKMRVAVMDGEDKKHQNAETSQYTIDRKIRIRTEAM